MAQRANHSNTIKEGEHYTDGGHWKSSAELGSLSGALPLMFTCALLLTLLGLSVHCDIFMLLFHSLWQSF